MEKTPDPPDPPWTALKRHVLVLGPHILARRLAVLPAIAERRMGH